MLKNLLVACGLVFASLSSAGCNLYFEESSSGGPTSPGPGGSPGTPGVPGTPPTGQPPGHYECGIDAECAAGCYCSEGACVEGGFCTEDKDCGDGLSCDEERNSCDPQGGGTCGGAVTCNEIAPNCPPDSSPLVENGCWTGACSELALCDVPPPCERINTEASCLARAECGAVYNGTNCRRTDGTACRAGDSGCTCETYSFDECRPD